MSWWHVWWAISGCEGQHIQLIPWLCRDSEGFVPLKHFLLAVPLGVDCPTRMIGQSICWSSPNSVACSNIEMWTSIKVVAWPYPCLNIWFLISIHGFWSPWCCTLEWCLPGIMWAKYTSFALSLAYQNTHQHLCMQHQYMKDHSVSSQPCLPPPCSHATSSELDFLVLHFVLHCRAEMSAEPHHNMEIVWQFIIEYRIKRHCSTAVKSSCCSYFRV